MRCGSSLLVPPLLFLGLQDRSFAGSTLQVMWVWHDFTVVLRLYDNLLNLSFNII